MLLKRCRISTSVRNVVIVAMKDARLSSQKEARYDICERMLAAINRR